MVMFNMYIMRLIANHFFLINTVKILVYSLLVFVICGLHSCTNDSFESMDYNLKENMTDEEILEWQKTLWLNTRAEDAPIGIIVTTKADISCFLKISADITVNWGDGNINIITPVNNPYTKISHTYTDDLPGHSITFTGPDNSITYLNGNALEIIHADFSRSIDLYSLDLTDNRLTNIYLNDNFNLKILYLASNNLSALNIDNLTNLTNLQIGTNPISSINVKNAGDRLLELRLAQTQIVNLDISENPNLTNLDIFGTNIGPIDLSSFNKLTHLALSEPYSQIDLAYFPLLLYLVSDNTKIKRLDISKNPLIEGISCNDSDLEDIILGNQCERLKFVNILSTPIEQNRRKIVDFAYDLPDRNNLSTGKLYTSSPYIENFRADVEDYNWTILTNFEGS